MLRKASDGGWLLHLDRNSCWNFLLKGDDRPKYESRISSELRSFSRSFRARAGSNERARGRGGELPARMGPASLRAARTTGPECDPVSPETDVAARGSK